MSHRGVGRGRGRGMRWGSGPDSGQLKQSGGVVPGHGPVDIATALALRRRKWSSVPNISSIGRIPALRVELLETLPTELIHQILDYIPQAYRVKVLLCLEGTKHFAACARTHELHGKGLECLQDKDFANLAELLRTERHIWGQTEDIKKRLSLQQLPAINVRICLFYLRHLTLSLPSDTFDKPCYNSNKWAYHYHYRPNVDPETSWAETVPGPPVHRSSSVCPELFDRQCQDHDHYSLSNEADLLCINERRRRHSALAMSRAIYKLVWNLKAAQLRRLADLVAKHPYVLRSSLDPERAARANHEHLENAFRTRAKKCDNYQPRSSDVRLARRQKPMACYFRGPCLPLVPLDSCLDLVLQRLEFELGGCTSDESFTNGADLAAWFQSMWNKKLAQTVCPDQTQSTDLAARQIYEKMLSRTSLWQATQEDSFFNQLGHDISTFVAGLGQLFDYKRTDVLPRIEILSSRDEGKGKQVETNPSYDVAWQRYRIATTWTDSGASQCSVGPHTEQSFPMLQSPKRKWQFIDYMSTNATRFVPMDGLSAPLDEREFEWLESFLRLANTFHGTWSWGKNHEGDCSFPEPRPLMTRVDGIRRAAWTSGLESGRDIENPNLAARRIIAKATRYKELPGARPWYV